MFPRYYRHSYTGKRRYRRKTSVGAMKLGVKLRVARRKSMTYLDKLGDWIEKAQSLKYGWHTIARIPEEGGRGVYREREISGKKGRFIATHSIVLGKQRQKRNIGRVYESRPEGSLPLGKIKGGPIRAKVGRKLYREAGFSKKSLEKAQSLKYGWSSQDYGYGRKMRSIRGPQGELHVLVDKHGTGSVQGSRYRKRPRHIEGDYENTRAGKEGRKTRRLMYRKLGLSTKSLEKAGGTNGFHAKPDRKVKAKQFKVHGSFKKKQGSRSETFTTAGSTSN